MTSNQSPLKEAAMQERAKLTDEQITAVLPPMPVFLRESLYDYEQREVIAYVVQCARALLASPPIPKSKPDRVYLVATGIESDGQETYTRHEARPPPLCDAELLWSAPPCPDDIREMLSEVAASPPTLQPASALSTAQVLPVAQERVALSDEQIVIAMADELDNVIRAYDGGAPAQFGEAQVKFDNKLRALLAAAPPSAVLLEVMEQAPRAFEIADEAMFEQLRDFGVLYNDKDHVGIGGEDLSEVSKLDDAGACFREAFDWLQPRGYVELGKDEDGEFIKVLKRPGQKT